MMGKLISIEGPDGVGKTTATLYLVALLKDAGYSVVHTREPGGTILAEKIRNLVLDKNTGEKIIPLAELLLFTAARIQHVENLIKPSISAGKIVICDRFTDSTYAYQGCGRGLHEYVRILEEQFLEEFEPDYTLFFNASLDVCEQRLSIRAGTEAHNRYDEESRHFKQRVFNGFQERFHTNRHRMHEILADNNTDTVKNNILNWFHNFFVINNPL